MKLGLEHLDAGTTDGQVDDSRAYFEARQAAGGQRGPTTYEELLAARRLVPSGPDVGRAVERTVHVGPRAVSVRVTAPSGGISTAVYLEIHGGGFFMDSARRGDARNAHLADTLDVTVASIDYRLSPEHPWPAAPDDCETAALWLINESSREFGTEQLLIGGDSCGATLTAATLLRLRDRGVVQSVGGAVMQYGAYDLSGCTPGGRRYADEWFVEAYAGHVSDRTLPDVSPLWGDLAGLPPTLLVVGTRDVLLDDNVAMAGRLAVAGNDVDLRVFPEAMHGFVSHPTALAAEASVQIERWIFDRVQRRSGPAARRSTST